MRLYELYEASRRNDIKKVNELLEKGLIPDVFIFNETILYNFTDLINLFLPYSIQYNIQTINSIVITGNDYLFDLVIDIVNPDHSTLTEVLHKQSIKYLNRLIEKEIYPRFSDLSNFLFTSNVNVEFFLKAFSHVQESLPSEIELEAEDYNIVHPLMLDILKTLQVNVCLKTE